MRLWLRGLVRPALTCARGLSRSPGQSPPLPIPQKMVATWEAICLGMRPVPEYFNFAQDVLDAWSQLEKVTSTVSYHPFGTSQAALGYPRGAGGYRTCRCGHFDRTIQGALQCGGK